MKKLLLSLLLVVLIGVGSWQTPGQAGSFKAAIYLQDDGEAISATEGFFVTYRLDLVDNTGRRDQWMGAAKVPFAPSAATMKTAIQNEAIRQAAGRGWSLSSQDFTLIGGLM